MEKVGHSNHLEFQWLLSQLQCSGVPSGICVSIDNKRWQARMSKVNLAFSSLQAYGQVLWGAGSQDSSNNWLQPAWSGCRTTFLEPTVQGSLHMGRCRQWRACGWLMAAGIFVADHWSSTDISPRIHSLHTLRHLDGIVQDLHQ